MNITKVIAVAVLLTAGLILAGCASTGSAERPVLDPKDADAVVKVKGMSCPQCSFNIALLMRDVEEIDQSRVDLGNGQVYIAFAQDKTLEADAITDLVTRAGFTPGEVKYLKKGDQ